MRELDSAKLLSASLKLSESRSTELVNKLRRELASKFDNIQLVEGVDGPQGPTGRQGDRGERGFIGGTGARGERGIPGLTGEEGATGERGIQGLTGEQGIQGLTGEQGIQGATGEQGIQGATGERGEPGEKGDQGIQGAEGPMGLRGERGLTGDAGINGKNGIEGKAGINGKNGIEGKAGINGKNGIDGKAGINGKNGIDGKVGPRGDKGDPGSDANVAPLEKKFDQLTKTVDTKLSKIAYTAAMGTSAGSGEVNLRNLDDVDYNSVSSPTDGHSLVYNGTLGKWQANSGSGGISTATFNSALANTNSFIAANALTERQHLANTNSFIKAQLANTNTFIATKTSTSTFNSALANTNLAITNVKTGLTTTNTALRLLINDRLQVANAVTLYATKAGPTTSGLLAHTGRATISTNLTVSGNTTSNKTTVTSSLISSGNTVLNGGLSANGSFGTANYVLKTNGAGIFWAAAASGGSDTSKLAVANSFIKLTSYSSNTHGITQLANNVISTTALTTNPAGHITLLLPNNTTIKIAYWL